MQISMLINSVTTPKYPTKVTLQNGSEVMADVAIVEVELVDETGQHGSRTMRFFTPEEKEFALAKYTQGEMISVEL
jgi:hypothetical protein